MHSPWYDRRRVSTPATCFIHSASLECCTTPRPPPCHPCPAAAWPYTASLLGSQSTSSASLACTRHAAHPTTSLCLCDCGSTHMAAPQPRAILPCGHPDIIPAAATAPNWPNKLLTPAKNHQTPKLLSSSTPKQYTLFAGMSLLGWAQQGELGGGEEGEKDWEPAGAHDVCALVCSCVPLQR